jgi:hypothetical protein
MGSNGYLPSGYQKAEFTSIESAKIWGVDEKNWDSAA